jgi:opacity protein-like surface antigen
MFSGDDDFKGDNDLKGGIGYNINDQMGVELSYNSNDGTMDAGGTDVTFRYTRVRISFL